FSGDFHIVLEIKVRFFKLVDTDITIFTPRGVTCALWMNSDVIQRTEMTLHSTNLITKHLVVESSFKLTLSHGRSGDVSGFLTTTKNDEFLDWGNGGGVQWGICFESLEHLQSVNIDDMRSLVFRRGDEVGSILGKLQIGD
ncbi:hypothetical protein WICPIJ_008456, partial [Wickerhamomyces pijperi]